MSTRVLWSANGFAALGAVFAAAGLVLGTTACGSDAPSSAPVTPTPSAASTTAAPAAPPATLQPTIRDYIREAGITETPVKRGDPDAPTIDLPVPAGWRDPGPQTPRYAYAARVYDDPAVAADPATILALVSKLTGPVDGARLLTYASGELRNLPGFEGSSEGTANPLSGFDAVQLGGSYVQDGNRRMIAQKTVVIPAADGNGVYVLQLNANGLESQMSPLLAAVRDIDENTRITS